MGTRLEDGKGPSYAKNPLLLWKRTVLLLETKCDGGMLSLDETMRN